MYIQIALLVVASLSAATAAPSGLYAHGAALGGPVVGASALAGPVSRNFNYFIVFLLN